jgi:hypothetical protein
VKICQARLCSPEKFCYKLYLFCAETNLQSLRKNLLMRYGIVLVLSRMYSAQTGLKIRMKGSSMAKTTHIHVSKTDNELYIIASTAAGSSEIVHLKSGFNNPVSYDVVPQSILPPGNYDLTVVGINWGGPWAFDVVLTPPSTPIQGSGSGPVGVVFSKTVSITV